MIKPFLNKLEISELEALEIRGGAGPGGVGNSQTGCVNNVATCGWGITQTGCSNNVAGCGQEPITQVCTVNEGCTIKPNPNN